MWHVTCDTLHVTCDIWWGVNILSKCKLPNSYVFFYLWYLKIWRKRLADTMTEWINKEGVCKTAPATPGLLIIYIFVIYIFVSENKVWECFSDCKSLTPPAPRHCSAQTARPNNWLIGCYLDSKISIFRDYKLFLLGICREIAHWLGTKPFVQI